MKKLPFLALAAFLALPAGVYLTQETPALITQWTKLNQEELETIAQSITVKIIAGDNSGSGVLIKKQDEWYTVVTNKHNLQGETVEIKTVDGLVHPGEILQQWENKDLALLQFRSEENYQLAKLSNQRKIAENQPLYAAGFPWDSNTLSFTAGELKLVKPKGLRQGYQLGYNNQIAKGMSGGPILTNKGMVIGINGLLADAPLGNPYVDSRYNSPEERDLINSYSWGIPLQGIFPQSTASRRETRDSSLVEDIRNTASSVTVRIEMTSEGTNGSGVIIARRKNNYYVLTNEHVVRQTQERTRLLAVIAPDGKRYEVQDKTVKTLSNMDLAVLQFRSSNDYEVATLGQNNLTETGGYVFLSGFPGNKDELDFTVGNLFQEKDKAVKAKDQLSFSYGYGLVYSNDSAPGMSGGPIFDVRGHVVGIHGRAEGENIVLQKGGSDRGKINIGYSLGVPIKSFLGLVDGVEMESGWLTVDETQLSKLSFIEEKEIDSALPELTPPVEKANPIAWLKYGNKLWRRSKYEEALAAFNEAIKLDRSLYLAWYGKGQTFLDRREYGEALEALLKAIEESEGQFALAWGKQGEALYRLAYAATDISKEKYEEALELALESINIALALDKEHISFYFSQGFILYELKRYQETIVAYNEVIAINGDAIAYNNRGIAHDKLGNYQFGIEDYNQAIALAPKYANAYYNRGNTHHELGKYEEAIEDYNQAIALNPQLVEAYNNRGATHDKLGNYQFAIEDYNQAIALDPQDASAYNNRGNTHHDLGKYQFAIEDYNQAIALNPQDASAYNNRGGTHDELGNYQFAIQDYNQAIALNPQFALAYMGRSLNHSRLGNYQKAMEDYNKAIKINPALEERFKDY